MLTDEYRYKILKILETNPEISQRGLAHELDISLGRVNFCLKALIEKGLLKATNFRNSRNKLAYMYLLTPSGIEEKSVVVHFSDEGAISRIAAFSGNNLKSFENSKELTVHKLLLAHI